MHDTIWFPVYDSNDYDTTIIWDLKTEDFFNADSSTMDSIPYVWSYAMEDSTCVTCRDNYGKLEDWIELYNAGNEPIDITGYYLSDKETNLVKYQIPSCSPIPAKGFKIIFASGRNLIENDTIHTNFRLTQTKDKKETIFLSDKNGNLIDAIDIRKTKGCSSYGRVNDGVSNWGVFVNPTAGKSNSNEKSFIKYSPKPKFSHDAGFYSSAIAVSISGTASENETIYYSVDGSEPGTQSYVYTAPVSIDKTTILKAIIADSDTTILPGFIQYGTYFISENHSLPVISISGSLLDSLAMGLKEARPWGTIEYFDTSGTRAADSYGEFNSHGQDSWVNDQRSLDFVARDEMGYSKELKEKLFTLSDRKNFQRIILRASGDDNYPATTDGIQNISNLGSAHLRDAYFQNLCKQGDMKLDVRAASKCVVYLNGNYWGVYDIREIPDDHDYTEHYYNQGKYDIQYLLTWGYTWAEYGGEQAFEDWYELTDFIFSHSMANQSNFDKVAAELDVESLTDYVIGHSISVSSDWLVYNTGWWRGLNPEGDHKKWGYILWDNDASFAFYINYTGIPDTSANAAFCNVDHLTEWSDPERHIQILNKLRGNPGFNNYYISRYIDLINTTFSCENMLHQLDSLKALIAPEMYRHNERWPGGSYEEWEKNYDRLRDFVTRRCGAWAENKLDSCYNLTGPYNITFDALPRENIALDVNSLQITNLPWNAAYFGNIDIALNAYDTSTFDKPFYKWKSNESVFLKSESIANNSLRINKNDQILALFQEETGIDDNKANMQQVHIYPTFVSDNFTVHCFLQSQSEVLISLYTIDGKKLEDFYSGTIAAGEHELSFRLKKQSLKDGIYFIQFNSNDFTKNEKIIVSHE